MAERLYANRARDLQTAIATGAHEPGSLLPGENELAETHGASGAGVAD